MKIAYFTMEIGLNESIPTYSGGLGILAGDHIKSAADLGLPLVAVSLLYKRGYFMQNISPMGWQEEMYPYFDPRAFMEPLPMKISVPMAGREVKVGVWKYAYQGFKGKVPIYFLDADLDDNKADDRLVTQYLYGGDSHTRICQEAILGIGGYKAQGANHKVKETGDSCQEDEGAGIRTMIWRRKALEVFCLLIFVSLAERVVST
ncbi:MAG: glycogen/starch/alpha-glucan phosphorylase [Deltaproteobacteria bacterium]